MAEPTEVAIEYASGVSDHPCEVTEEMREVMRANSRALDEMMAERKITMFAVGCSHPHVLNTAVASTKG